jgi:class 3 adenylate cyclase
MLVNLYTNLEAESEHHDQLHQQGVRMVERRETLQKQEQSRHELMERLSIMYARSSLLVVKQLAIDVGDYESDLESVRSKRVGTSLEDDFESSANRRPSQKSQVTDLTPVNPEQALDEFLQFTSLIRAKNAVELALNSFKRSADFITKVPLHPITLSFTTNPALTFWQGLRPTFGRRLFALDDLVIEEMDEQERARILRLPSPLVHSQASVRASVPKAADTAERVSSKAITEVRSKGDLMPISVGGKIDPAHEDFFRQLRFYRSVQALRIITSVVFLVYLVMTILTAISDGQPIKWTWRILYFLWSLVLIVYLESPVFRKYSDFIVCFHVLLTPVTILSQYLAYTDLNHVCSDIVYSTLLWFCTLLNLVPGVSHTYMLFASSSFLMIWIITSIAIGGAATWYRWLEALSILFATFAHARKQEKHDRRHYILMQCIQSEGLQMERVLLEMIPPDFRNKLYDASKKNLPLREYANITILYGDLQGFSGLTATRTPVAILNMLRDLFRRFDQLLLIHGVFKLDTIGDSYVCMSTSTKALCQMALAMQSILKNFNKEFGYDLQLRLGIATGPVFSSVVGTTRFRYHAWGFAVRMAYRLQQAAPPGQIRIDVETYNLVQSVFRAEVWEDSDQPIFRTQSKGSFHRTLPASVEFSFLDVSRDDETNPVEPFDPNLEYVVTMVELDAILQSEMLLGRMMILCNPQPK